jgi:phytoene synthase
MAQWTPAPAQLTMAYSVCRGITRASAKNFYYAFLILPKRKRQALCAVYAFMRRCDDIADDPGLSAAERRHKLDTWLEALHRSQQGNPSDDPILLDELALGTAMDVVESDVHTPVSPDAACPLTVQYETFDDLKLYCRRVASVVGLVCIHIFGYRDPAAEPLAEQCGLAFQLTNIIRDVKEDAAMGRVYFPGEDLSKFGLSAASLMTASDSAEIRPLLAFEADRAREYYKSGDQLISYISEDSQPALYVLVNIYRKLLEKISGKDYDVFTARVSLTVTEKLRVLAKGFWLRIV